MSILKEVKTIIVDALQLGERVADFNEDTALLGNIPELDSMAVVTVITALEDYYGFVVDDDEITGETFMTLGSLVQFVEEKVNG